MNTCKTCKHWTKRTGKNERVERGQCENEKLDDNFGELSSDGLSYEYYESGGIFTGPNFGCVHHEAQ